MNGVISFSTRRQRPHRLSNQNCCYTDAEVQRLLTVPDCDLDWRAFYIIFHMSGCTATRDEQIYFLPLALENLRAHPRDGYQYLSEVVHFISSHANALDADNLLHPTLDGLRACFSMWTADFIVQHFDTAACRAKGWVLDHDDIVLNSQFVADLIDDLLRYSAHSALAEELVCSWSASPRSDLQAAWLLEYAREERRAYLSYPHPSYSHPRLKGVSLNMAPTRDNPRIHSVVADQALLQACYSNIVPTIVRRETSPTYWSDLVTALGLTAV